MRLLLWLCAALCHHHLLASAFISPSVELYPGTYVIGIRKRIYDAYYGIPFAKPPTGELRFRDPEPASWWTGVFRAIIPRLYCWQYDQLSVPIPPSGTEDCLYLNIYRPRSARRSRKRLNVVVFIHGGAYAGGTANPLFGGPEYLMETGQVILVTIAYRLNVFGFLSTGDSAAPGNYGLKDQQMALKWVQRHVGAFGGDPDQVTLMGFSAGASSANLHMLAKGSHGLFKNVYMISGGVFSGTSQEVKENPRDTVNRHAEAIGIRAAAQLDSASLVKVLRRVPARVLSQALLELHRWDILPLAVYGPVVEPADSPNAFLTVNPRHALVQGKFLRVPVMNSVVPGDGLIFVQPIVRKHGKFNEFNANMRRILPVILGMDRHHPNMSTIVDLVRLKYFGYRGVVAPASLDRVVRMASDYFYHAPLYRTCQAMARYTPVYAHRFEYRGDNSLSLLYTRSLRNFGVVHGDDLLYLLKIPGIGHHNPSREDVRMQALFMRHVINFVKYDDPGYPAWDVREPEITRFVRGDRGAVRTEQVPAKRHAFWSQIEDVYELWRRGGAGLDKVAFGNFSLVT